MRSRTFPFALTALVAIWTAPADLTAQADSRLESLKEEALAMVEARAKMVQEIVDMQFSLGELGMQEFETQAYLTGILEEHGFDIELGVAGMPSAWTARWSNGSGEPVIALGSDVDGIPQSNQKPGVAYRDPILSMAPGHGEGHNSGQAVNIVAAIAVKELMERDDIDGTLLIWPGIAEEQLGSKAFFVRDGVFDGVDVNLFTHVSSNFGVSWGQSGGNALVSAMFRFTGETAHSAGSPWRGRSALDAVMLLAQAWEFKREHLRPPERSHYIIVDGGDQPNVVPQTASIWFFFREVDYERTQASYDAAKLMAEGAALMTGTEVDTIMTIGSAWSRHFNKPVAEVTHANIQRVGLPEWSEDDVRFAEAFQREMGQENPRGLADSIGDLGGPVDLSRSLGGGSDDIGDVSWNMPTVTLRYPANMPGGPGHNWANGIAMATPIAHKGALAGAKVQALTLLDLFLDGRTVEAAWEYFEEQTAETTYTPFISPTDEPAIWLNEDIMAEWRERMRPYYYDPSRFDTYMEQLGIEYPTIRTQPVSEDAEGNDAGAGAPAGGGDGSGAPDGSRAPGGSRAPSGGGGPGAL